MSWLYKKDSNNLLYTNHKKILMLPWVMKANLLVVKHIPPQMASPEAPNVKDNKVPEVTRVEIALAVQRLKA